MSGGTSAIVNLFIAIYGRSPSSQTIEALIRAEQVLGLTQEDALARFYVVLLHAADRFDASVERRASDEQKLMAGLSRAVLDLARIVREVDDAGPKVVRIAHAWTFSDNDLIPVHRSASPLFAYLRHAFYLSSHGKQDAERIKAARVDLLTTSLLLAAIMTTVIGAVVYSFVS